MSSQQLFTPSDGVWQWRDHSTVSSRPQFSLVFVIDRDGDRVSSTRRNPSVANPPQLLLGFKKRGFGRGLYV